MLQCVGETCLEHSDVRTSWWNIVTFDLCGCFLSNLCVWNFASTADFSSIENHDIHNDIHLKPICMHAHACRNTQSLEVRAEAQSTVRVRPTLYLQASSLNSHVGASMFRT